MIYFSYSLDLLPLVHQLSVVTYTNMWYDKMIPLLPFMIHLLPLRLKSKLFFSFCLTQQFLFSLLAVSVKVSSKMKQNIF